MNTSDELKIRKIIGDLEIGQSVTIDLPTVKPEDVKETAMAYAKGRKKPISVTILGGKLVATRIEEWATAGRYPEIETLEVGSSHLFRLPPAFHQRIRQAATFRNKMSYVRLSCTVEPDGIRVTRLPVTAGECEACGPIEAPKKVTKYDLDRLSELKELRFSIEPRDQHKLRLAVTQKGKLTGWRIRCRIQDDGSMLVYRMPESDVIVP